MMNDDDTDDDDDDDDDEILNRSSRGEGGNEKEKEAKRYRSIDVHSVVALFVFRLFSLSLSNATEREETMFLKIFFSKSFSFPEDDDDDEMIQSRDMCVDESRSERFDA